MELKPYIEEPLSRAMPSSCVNANRSPRIRHDFVFSKQDAVDAYWETLEYCYATAAPADASHAFPGSSAPEVFHPRSWTSLRVMTAEQHVELLNHVTNVDRQKKISLKDCIRIARELDLTVEQVLRISYNRRQSRPCGIPRKLISKEQGNYPDARSSRSSSQKRKRSYKDVIVDHAEENDNTGRSSKPKISNPPLIEEKENNSLRIPPCENNGIHLPAPGNDNRCSDEHEYEMHEEDSENHAFIKQCAFLNRKSMRRKRFMWTDKSDRLEEHDAPVSRSFFTDILASISDIKFSKDGRHILSRDYMTLKLWDINMDSGPVATFQVHEHLRPKLCDLYENDSIFDKFECCLSGDGFRVATGSYGNLFRVFGCTPGSNEATTLEASKNPTRFI